MALVMDGRCKKTSVAYSGTGVFKSIYELEVTRREDSDSFFDSLEVPSFFLYGFQIAEPFFPLQKNRSIYFYLLA